ncbi:hypothetical protein LTR64_001496 [Lithohypha guttulata]|uniref:uncharacterized protein n=1 Tax=Lithohypha guttulata TaxID=1690604 RepID=UPI002DDF5431|nr:hypothetical protein LTR51_003690 [Lithohypha guttulata]
MSSFYTHYYNEPWPSYYVPEPWKITSIPHHFPEHHYPLEHTRHAIGRTISTLGHAMTHPWEAVVPTFTPRIDVRESEKCYYVDVELAGVKGRDKVKLQWLSSRTLLLEAKTERPLTGEEGDEDGKEGKAKAAGTGDGGEGEGEAEGAMLGSPLTRTETRESIDPNAPAAKKKAAPPKISLFTTVKERQVGTVARAFTFPSAVDHATMNAHLECGLLSLKVPKISDEGVKDEHKMPEVKEGAKGEERAKI